MRFATSLCFFSSCLAVHDLVHVIGSSIVTAYSILSASRRVHRSTRCRFPCAPLKSDFGEKFVTSTTSVLPSQRPGEFPHHWRMVAGRCGAVVIGMMRDHPCPPS